MIFADKSFFFYYNIYGKTRYITIQIKYFSPATPFVLTIIMYTLRSPVNSLALSKVNKQDIESTLLQLRNDYCGLGWNIFLTAQDVPSCFGVACDIHLQSVY